jgi:hypothetical protein
VKDYDPNKTTDQVTWLQPSDYTNSTISYAWYVGGNGFEANVTVNGVTPKAWFDVRKPTDEVLAEANQLTNDYGKDGINPKTDSTTHLGVLNQLEMEILSRLG